MIPANNRYKIFLDFFVLLLLLFTCIVVPYRLAFTSFDPIGWLIVYGIVDLVFLFDVILTFFTSYTEYTPTGDVEVFELKKIAYNYIKSWLILDLLSILPIDYIFP